VTSIWSFILQLDISSLVEIVRKSLVISRRKLGTRQSTPISRYPDSHLDRLK